MSTELAVKYKWQDKDITLTKSDVRNLISTDPKVTDKEIALFMQLCKYQNLNPFVREVYLVKYGTYPASMVVGKEVFTKRAEQNKDFDGYEITDNYTAKLPLEEFEVTCKVFKKSVKHAITVTVSYTEYVGTDSKGNVNRMWKSKPRTMLRKVALMQGLREAFPTALGGLYEENELDQREVPKDITPESEEELPIEEEVDRNNEAIEEVEAIEEEVAKEGSLDKLSFDEMKEKYHDEDEAASKGKDTPKEETTEVEPASDKQKDYIYGGATNKGIVDSHLITKAEIKRIGKSRDLSKEKASKIMKWWWGDKDKNIVGEREKREKNPVEKPKTSGNDLERRKQLMHEVLALFNKNFLHKPMQKKFYKKYQKSDIKELAYEELVELKAKLEHYVPEDW